MSTDALRASATLTTSPLVAELFAGATTGRAGNALGWVVALGAHLLFAGLALGARPAAPPAPPPLEVELLRPEPPAPPPVAPPPPAPAETQPAPRVAPATSRPAAAPEPARVGALLTAKADPEPSAKAEEPVDFTNDPSALGFGSGVVAIGGKAQIGLAHAQPSTTPAPAAVAVGPRTGGDALTPVADLSRKPALNESDPCRGYFPSAASDDVASAAVLLTLAKSGAVSAVELVSESPPGQGFGAAARTCMAKKRFSPGLDQDGKPAATRIRVSIHFQR